MRKDIFNTYIIGNGLNLKMFFEPIIDFIEIGKPRDPLEPYMKISSRTAQTKRLKYRLSGNEICVIVSFTLLNLIL